MDKKRDRILVVDGIFYEKKEKKKEVVIKENRTGRLISLKINKQTAFHLLEVKWDKKKQENEIENSTEIKLEDFLKNEGVSAIIDKKKLLIDLRKIIKGNSFKKETGGKTNNWLILKKNNEVFFQSKKKVNINFEEKLKFLQSFSDQEFRLNGHHKGDLQALVFLFDLFLPYIQKGKLLDIGCCTGITTKFACLFAGKKIVPFGVDINPKAILLAQNNLEKYKNNFYTASFEDLDKVFLKQFSTVMLSIRFRIEAKKGMEILNRIYSFLAKNKNNFKKNSHIIIIFEDLFKAEDRGEYFLKEVRKKFEILFLYNSILVLRKS